MTTEIATNPEFQKLEKEGMELQARADAFIITDDLTRQQAAEELKGINSRIPMVEALTETPWREAMNSYDKIQKWRKGLIDRFLNPKKTYAAKIGEWDLTIQQKRQKESAAAQAKADAKARAQREADIAAAKARKDKEAVQALKEAPIAVAPAVVKTQEPTKVQGVGTRFKWVVDQIFDPNQIQRRWLVPDRQNIEKHVAATGAAHGISGITVKQVPIVSARS